jgi:hypothetical protein
MKRIKPLATLTLTLILTSITATLAHAAATIPSILPEATTNTKITGEAVNASGTITRSGNGVLSIESTKSKGAFELEALKLGRFRTSFEGFTNELTGEKCNGLGIGTPGLIEMEGEFHIRHYRETSLRTALLFLPRTVHFECGAARLIEWSGCIAGQLTPESVLTRFLTITLATRGNDNIIITVLRESGNGEEEACQMLAAENMGTFRLASLKTTQILGPLEQNGREITVLVMPL